MDGALALLAGLIAAGLIYLIPLAWLKAAGALLMVVTLLFMVADAFRLLFG